jgi:hypothetical protein
MSNGLVASRVSAFVGPGIHAAGMSQRGVGRLAEILVWLLTALEAVAPMDTDDATAPVAAPTSVLALHESSHSVHAYVIQILEHAHRIPRSIALIQLS